MEYSQLAGGCPKALTFRTAILQVPISHVKAPTFQCTYISSSDLTGVMIQIGNPLPNLLALRRRCAPVRRGGGGQVGQQLQASLTCASRHIGDKVQALCQVLQWCPRMGKAGFLAKLFGLSRGCALNLVGSEKQGGCKILLRVMNLLQSSS